MEETLYIATSNGARCCLSNGSIPQRCMIDLPESECRQNCTNDVHCKGYFMINNKRHWCQLSTTSTCIKSGPFGVGIVGPLDYNPPCKAIKIGTPCYIKQGNCRIIVLILFNKDVIIQGYVDYLR